MANEKDKEKVPKIEYERRVRMVQEWILEDWPTADILSQIITAWGLEERQAKRYIAEARHRWVQEETAVMDHKRRLKIETLRKLKRSLKDPYKGTPAGIKTLLDIEKEIISLEGIRPATKLEVTGKDGKDLYAETSDAELKQKLKDLMQELDEE